jgi:hypothetical protein
VEINRLPEYRKPTFDCPRCGAFAAQDWTKLTHHVSEKPGFSVVIDQDWQAVVEDLIHIPLEWEASSCHGCRQHALWINEVLAFPTVDGLSLVPRPHKDMPKDVAELYLEAAATLPHSKRAAAALCRAALEKLAKELTSQMAAKTRLDERLATLSLEASATLAQMIQVIRFAGNAALHGHDEDISAVIYLDEKDSTISAHFFRALNMLVEERITNVRAADEIYSTLPEGVRDEIARKLKLAAAA